MGKHWHLKMNTAFWMMKFQMNWPSRRESKPNASVCHAKTFQKPCMQELVFDVTTKLHFLAQERMSKYHAICMVWNHLHCKWFHIVKQLNATEIAKAQIGCSCASTWWTRNGGWRHSKRTHHERLLSTTNHQLATNFKTGEVIIRHEWVQKTPVTNSVIENR